MLLTRIQFALQCALADSDIQPYQREPDYTAKEMQRREAEAAWAVQDEADQTNGLHLLLAPLSRPSRLAFVLFTDVIEMLHTCAMFYVVLLFLL